MPEPTNQTHMPQSRILRLLNRKRPLLKEEYSMANCNCNFEREDVFMQIIIWQQYQSQHFPLERHHGSFNDCMRSR